jgi:carboxymethylenebutenolidase
MNIFTGTVLDDDTYDRDQASVLHQIGLLEIGNLPIVGVESAMKVMDESSVKSNELIKEWKERKTEESHSF